MNPLCWVPLEQNDEASCMHIPCDPIIHLVDINFQHSLSTLGGGSSVGAGRYGRSILLLTAMAPCFLPLLVNDHRLYITECEICL